VDDGRGSGAECRSRQTVGLVQSSDSTTATSSLSGFQHIYSSASSPFLTLWLVWCSDLVATIMSWSLLQLCIGCVYHNVLTSRWLSWCFVCCMVSHLHTSTILFVSSADLPGHRRLHSSLSHPVASRGLSSRSGQPVADPGILFAGWHMASAEKSGRGQHLKNFLWRQPYDHCYWA